MTALSKNLDGGSDDHDWSELIDQCDTLKISIIRTHQGPCFNLELHAGWGEPFGDDDDGPTGATPENFALLRKLIERMSEPRRDNE